MNSFFGFAQDGEANPAEEKSGSYDLAKDGETNPEAAKPAEEKSGSYDLAKDGETKEAKADGEAKAAGEAEEAKAAAKAEQIKTDIQIAIKDNNTRNAVTLFSKLLKDDKAGYIWREMYNALCEGRDPDIKYIDDHNSKYNAIATELYGHIKLDEAFLTTLKEQNKYNNPRSNNEIQHRVNSFFQLVLESVGSNGFFVCQEDGYLSLDKYVYGGKKHEMMEQNKIGFVRATKVKDGGKPAQSAKPDMFKEMGIPKAQYDGIIAIIGSATFLGDGVTLYYNTAAWECTEAKCSSGAKYTGTEYITSVPDVHPIVVSDSEDPFIVAKFRTRTAASAALIIATTHLESGEIHKKNGGKDKLRQSSVKLLTGVIKDIGDAPVIIGMDGNSSAYKGHTSVVDELTEYTTAIQGHIPDAITDPKKTSIVGMPISSAKKRGDKTNQPYKPEPIVALIDYLMIKGLTITQPAKLPLIGEGFDTDKFIEQYGLPSDWLNFILPKGDWSDINQWSNWASDHLPLKAVFTLGHIEFPFTTGNMLAPPLSNDGFLVGNKWNDVFVGLPKETQQYIKILRSEYNGLFDESQINAIIELGYKIYETASQQSISALNMFGFVSFNKTTVKSFKSIVDKLIYNILELMNDSQISFDDAFKRVSETPNVFVRDAVRLYYALTDGSIDLKSKTSVFLSDLQTKGYEFEEPIKDGTSSLGHGLIVKATSPSGYMFEMQFFTNEGKTLYETDGSHDIYKDIQRRCAKLRFYILTKDEENAERTYNELQVLFDKGAELLKNQQTVKDVSQSKFNFMSFNSMTELREQIKTTMELYISKGTYNSRKKGGTRRKRRILHKRTIRRKRNTKRRIRNNHKKTRRK
jgi:hypothetical protein